MKIRGLNGSPRAGFLPSQTVTIENFGQGSTGSQTRENVITFSYG